MYVLSQLEYIFVNEFKTKTNYMQENEKNKLEIMFGEFVVIGARRTFKR